MSVTSVEARPVRRERRADTAPPAVPLVGRLRGPVPAAYALAGALLAAYGVSLLARRTGTTWSLVDNDLLDAFEVLVALGCLARGLLRRPGRGSALALGLGLLGWSVGDIVWTVESSGAGAPPTPSPADGCYLLLYPLAYAAVILLLRSYSGAIRPSAWLDGAVTGVGAAATCAAFAFDTILRATGGSPAAVAVNLAYPVGDLALLALVVGAVVLVPGRPARLLLLATGCALLVLGDTVYLFQSSAGTYHVGTLLDLTWPAGMLAMSASAWLPAARAGRSAVERTPSFVVPGLASVAGLLILVVGNLRHVSPVAFGLAAATMAMVALRTGVSLRELRRLTEARRRQAVTDELTGLGNRRQLLTELRRAFGDAEGALTAQEPLALLLIDLDHFKEINDSFGHPTGDEVLQQVGPLIRSVVRSSDIVARLGGDEFAVILTGADVEFASSVAERITNELTKPIELARTRLHVGASIGIALAPEHATTPDELLRCADVAMYRAKGARTAFDTYEAALDDGTDRITLMEELRNAIAARELTLYFQPQIDLHTGDVPTVEALLRWRHPRLGLVPPDQFLPLAEETGLIGQLTAGVLDMALAQCSRWWRGGHRVAVAVNLLASDLLDAELPQRVASLLEAAGLPGRALVLEITESMVMADLTRAKDVIGRLSRFGVVVSIDDFGTGFSSLAYLSDLAVGEMKLDRMFTARLHADSAGSRDEAIVRSAIELGHSLGLRVVAEGVERPELIGMLAHLGCDLGQGFAIEVPRPAEQLDLAALDRRMHPVPALPSPAGAESA